MHACRSTLEDPTSLTLLRGFLVAGAERVIGSLWKVGDRATMLEMDSFWNEIADAERSGRAVDPAHALRQAKLRLLRDPEWSHPFYWGSFVLVGRP